eukprot:COSAG04_NODE_11299_length_718_cov_0.494346_1_plen_152_part_10
MSTSVHPPTTNEVWPPAPPVHAGLRVPDHFDGVLGCDGVVILVLAIDEADGLGVGLARAYEHAGDGHLAALPPGADSEGDALGGRVRPILLADERLRLQPLLAHAEKLVALPAHLGPGAGGRVEEEAAALLTREVLLLQLLAVVGAGRGCAR